MLSLYDEASIAAVMEQPIEPALKSLLQARLDQAAAADLLSLTHLLVVQPGDTEAQIVTEIGFSPLVGRANGWDDALSMIFGAVLWQWVWIPLAIYFLAIRIKAGSEKPELEDSSGEA